MACAAIMRRRWRYRSGAATKCVRWSAGRPRPATRALDGRDAHRSTGGRYSRGPTVGHSTPRRVPSASRSIVGA